MGPDRNQPVHDQIRRESAALRAWATAVRASSEAVRTRSQAMRSERLDRRAAAMRPFGAHETPREAPAEDATSLWDPLTTPEPIPVSDLFLILVEHHQLGVREAVHALALEMKKLGCPDDADTIPAADAIDIIQAIVNPH